MIRAVIDTNLLVSYALTKGETLSRIIDHWEKGTFIYLTSPQIIEELKDVLQRPRLQGKMAADPQPLIDIVVADTEQTPGELALEGVCRDPKACGEHSRTNDIFIACAVEGEADYIVTGDRDLLELDAYRGIKIIQPERFVGILNALQGVAAQDEVLSEK